MLRPWRWRSKKQVLTCDPRFVRTDSITRLLGYAHRVAFAGDDAIVNGDAEHAQGLQVSCRRKCALAQPESSTYNEGWHYNSYSDMFTHRIFRIDSQKNTDASQSSFRERRLQHDCNENEIHNSSMRAT